jgi:hypothetical protein
MVTIEFPKGWADATRLEQILRSAQAPHDCAEVTFGFCPDSKIMIDAAVRLLALLNQLDACTRRVVLRFDDGATGVMGYLNRMGFVDHLSKGIDVLPDRPTCSGAAAHGGHNAGIVEIAGINHKLRDQGLPTRLTKALTMACGSRPDAGSLGNAAWTIFTELIDNVFSHSQTPLDGYAALQVYARGNIVKVAVSDSGLEIHPRTWVF